MKALILTVLSSFFFFHTQAQAPGDTAYYFNSPKISRAAKDYYAGKYKATDDPRTLSILDSLQTRDNSTRPFYIYLVSKMMKSSDGALNEAKYLRDLFSRIGVCLAGKSQGDALPAWFDDIFKSKGLDKRYEVRPFLAPAFLQTDLNGDGVNDLAVLVVEKKTGKKGVLILHGGTDQYYLFGAGTKAGNSDDLKWAKRWGLFKKKKASETQFSKTNGDIIGSKTIQLKRTAILIEDMEDGAAIAGGLIYWNGKNYIWIHQGE